MFHQPVAWVQAHVTHVEIQHWEAYYELEPFGDDWSQAISVINEKLPAGKFDAWNDFIREASTVDNVEAMRALLMGFVVEHNDRLKKKDQVIRVRQGERPQG